MTYRIGNYKDIQQLRALGVKSWSQYQNELTNENWEKLYQGLNNLDTYKSLLDQSECLVCVNQEEEIIGMSFLVPKGNPTDIYDENWCYIRFVSVNPDYRGNGIGAELTKWCIQSALKNDEQTIALHTSEIMKSARKLYEKIGFKILKEIEPRLGVKYWLYTLEL